MHAATNTMSNDASSFNQDATSETGLPGQQLRRRLCRRQHDRHEEWQGEHRQQQLGQSRVDRHRGEQRSDGDEADRRQQARCR